MRVGAIFGFIIALGVWVFGSAVWAQTPTSEYIARADITVQFDKDGSLKIREEIDYIKPRGTRKRGIFRELPSTVREGAVTYRKSYRLTLVTRNGQTETVTESREDGTFNWRLGRADVYLEDGPQRYVLEYESDDWVIRSDDLDEVYWNVWGEYWNMPVRQLTGRFVFPEGAAAKQIAAYSGRYGSTENDITIKPNGNVINFSANGPLAAYEGATIAVGFDKGVFDPLTPAEASARWWRANGALLGLVFITPAVLAFYFLKWSKVGRDPVKPPVFARYEAPDNYSAAAAHRILNKGLNGNAALISTLVSLGIKKRLEIDVSKKQTVLTPLASTAHRSEGLNPEEHRLFETLFRHSPRPIVLQKNTPNSHFHKTVLSFKGHLNKAYSTDYHKVNGKYIFGGIVLSAIGLFAVLSSFSTPSSLLFWGLVAGLVLINIIFMFLMPAPTKKGAKIASEIEGFKLYLETAEKLRLNSAEVGTDQVPPMSEQRYEAFLPYAVALGVEKPWTKHFEKTLPVIAKNYNPSYYNSYRGRGLGIGGLGGMNRDMVKALASGVASARPVQTSSSGSSSGGGSSGGGGGGGGGGSW